MRDRFQTEAHWFVAVTWIIGFTNDGWSGRPSPLTHQLLLLPVALAFAYSLFRLLRLQRDWLTSEKRQVRRFLFTLGVLCCLSEVLSIFGFLYEGHHFAPFGYFLPSSAMIIIMLVTSLCFASILCAARWPTGATALGGVLLSYVAGVALAIAYFPLSYLRSDMLPVILWADERLASHLDPYTTMHVGLRLYDFPYLPGMLLVYLPAVLVHIDLRFTNLACDVALGFVLYFAARQVERRAAALLVGVFLLSPFLQYRHDLYLAPHWLTLVLAIALMRWRHFAWAALIFGFSMGIYQLSWVIFPFLILNAYRRGGWGEATKLTALSGADVGGGWSVSRMGISTNCKQHGRSME